MLDHQYRRRQWHPLRWLTACLIGGVLWVIWSFFFPEIPVEMRTERPGGRVDFTTNNLNALDLADWTEGIRGKTKPSEKVKHMIYGDPAVYLFTTKGRVFALCGNESGVPPSLLEAWEWSGDPHDFPYYHGYDCGGP